MAQEKSQNQNEQDTSNIEALDLNHPYLKNRVVLLNGFSREEIVAIMQVVKGLCKPDPQKVKDPKDLERPWAIDTYSSDLIFAMTTPISLQNRLGDVIIDMSGDHAYLKANPPQKKATQ